MNLPKIYEPHEYEENIYALWEKEDVFSPKGEGQSYSLVVPPPNANGDLHLGHALTLAIEDIAARYHRLKGERVLFVPGADHAGFETWVVYEKELAKQGKSRFDFSREQLFDQVWDFVSLNRHNFESNFRKLGASVDWKHFTFTLDNEIIDRAYATFKKMWDEGLVYRGNRLVNYCTHHGTGFADIEVNYKSEEGKLWYIRYPLSDGGGDLVVATTRPETMLGDTAVAVNPDDDRYIPFMHKTVMVPLINREIPVIVDRFVDKDYGTGAVKITPAHDFNDNEVAERHNLPLIQVIDHEGKIAPEMPEKYRNMSIEQAREAIVQDLTNAQAIVKTETITHSVGHCYKCDTVIEPMLREQWFIDMKPLASRAVEAIQENKIDFIPATKKDQLIRYLQGLQDWNISRQIAWGIPIPAFQNVNNPEDWIYDEHVANELIEKDGETYRRDPDVFDTWFSSGSWPYATLGYPDSEDYKDFYPLSVMETGSDLLHQWVARMLMLGLYVTDEVPFRRIYFHGMVLDEHGQKMSKSKGNVINPQDYLESYGSDALRMGIITGQTAGGNQPFIESRIVAARNFGNKLWNIARYIENRVGEESRDAVHPEPKYIVDHWILKRLRGAIDSITSSMDSYRFSEAYETLYHFIWDEFADWYIEVSKLQQNNNTLIFCFESILKLTHPFAPFLTETIWQTLGWKNSILASATWPELELDNDELAAQFDEIKNIITEVRYIATSLRLKETKLHYIAPQFIKDNAEVIEKLTHIQTVTEVQMSPGLRLLNNPYQCWLDVSNKQLESYVIEIKVKTKALQDEVFGLEARLANPDYTTKAPAQIVNQTRQTLLEKQNALATLQQEKKRFEPTQIITATPTTPNSSESSEDHQNSSTTPQSNETNENTEENQQAQPTDAQQKNES